MKVMMVDPPAGWMFGFPKAIPPERKDDLENWLVEEGYPRAEIKALGAHFYVRVWEEDQ